MNRGKDLPVWSSQFEASSAFSLLVCESDLLFCSGSGSPTAAKHFPLLRASAPVSHTPRSELRPERETPSGLLCVYVCVSSSDNAS